MALVSLQGTNGIDPSDIVLTVTQVEQIVRRVISSRDPSGNQYSFKSFTSIGLAIPNFLQIIDL
jgi:hypothetical protein